MIYSLSCLDEDDPEERRGIDVFFYFWIIDLRLVFYYWSSVTCFLAVVSYCSME